MDAYTELAAIRRSALRRLPETSHSMGRRTAFYIRRLIELRMTPLDFRRYPELRQAAFGDPVIARAVQWAKTYYRLTDLRSRYFAERTRGRIIPPNRFILRR